MVIAEQFTVKVSAKAKNTEKDKTGAEEPYNVPDGYFINATVKSPENQYGWTYVDDSSFGKNARINVRFGDPIQNNDGRPPLYRTVYVSATVSGEGQFKGGGSVHYTFIGYRIKIE